MKPLIIIPAYNEAENIPELVRNIQKLQIDYLVINDCSKDQSAQLYSRLNINHLDLSVNLGLASVTQVGFKYALDEHYDCAIVIDGDGQHPPKYIQPLLKEIEEGYDVAIGSRFLQEKKPWTMRMIGSRIISVLIYLKTGRWMTDPTSGMRAMGKRVIQEFAENLNYVAEPDALTYLLRRKYRVRETPVKMEKREKGESYFTSPIKSIQYMVNVILSILLIQW